MAVSKAYASGGILRVLCRQAWARKQEEGRRYSRAVPMRLDGSPILSPPRLGRGGCRALVRPLGSNLGVCLPVPDPVQSC